MRAEPDTLRQPSRRVLLPRPEMARYVGYVRFLRPGCPKYPDTISDTALWHPEATSPFPPSADRLRYIQAVLGAGSLTECSRDNCPAAYEYRASKSQFNTGSEQEKLLVTATSVWITSTHSTSQDPSVSK